MKTKKRGSSSSSGRFTRGTKVSSKKSGSGRRHARKSSSRRSAPKEGFMQKLEELSPL